MDSCHAPMAARAAEARASPPAMRHSGASCTAWPEVMGPMRLGVHGQEPSRKSSAPASPNPSAASQTAATGASPLGTNSESRVPPSGCTRKQMPRQPTPTYMP
eukprot:scaffold18987_cov109-Isochrysis_galbana.AAC.22